MKMWCRLAVFFMTLGCHLINASHFVQKLGPCNFLDTINITSGHFDQNGNFHHKDVVYKKGTFNEYDYIIENFTQIIKVEPHIRGCVCMYKPCVRLCCVDEFHTNPPCVKTKTINVPTQDEEEEEIDLEGNRYGVLVGRPCGRMYQLEPAQYSDDKWIFVNGTVQLVESEEMKMAGHKDFCFGQATNETSGDVTTDVLFCHYDGVDVRMTLYPIGMIFSLPFLVITFCVYGFIPELRNLHGKCLMCYVFGLSVFYISLSVVQLEGNTFEVQSNPCISAGFMIYISILLCFFWLNVMCFDIWSTFKGLRGRNSDRRRFLVYCCYAFGTPCVLTAITYLIDVYVPDTYGNYKPRIGMTRCWLQEVRTVELIYMYIPISTILLVNITLYSITAYKINKVQRETSTIRNGDSQKHSKSDADKDRFFLYLRLFIVMGVTWVMEAISWVFQNSQFLFYVSDILNCLQGFIIFMLFVWKPKVKQLIIKRYRSIRNLPPLSSQAHSGSVRTETSRISSGIHNHNSIKCQEKPMLDY